MRRFDDIKVGDSAEITHLLTDRDLARFVELTGDDNRLHVDATYSANTSFKKPVVHGMLGASFISTIIGTKLPGDGALWFSQTLDFILPVRVGDKLTVQAEVLSKDARSQVIELRTDILNQHRQKVTAGVAKVKLIDQIEAPLVSAESKLKIALVVGGGGGIGSAICRMLAQDGFAVAVHYFSSQSSAATVSDRIESDGGLAMTVGANIQVESEILEMIEKVSRKFGGISVLVNCATAKLTAMTFSKLRWEDFSSHLDTTIQGSFLLARNIAPLMISQKYGKIINIGSQAAESPSPDWLPYVTAKAALVGFTRALALELAPKGILVNLVSPGMTETDLISEVPERARLLAAAKTPIRRLATPQDIAGAVAFLASNRADYLVGETIRVNGGQVML